MQLQLRGPDIREDGDFRVYVNGSGMRDGKPGFATIELDEAGHTDFYFDTPEEIDALIKAACEARRLLLAARVPHPFRAGDDAHRCGECSVMRAHHAEPEHAEPAVPGPVMCGYEYAVDGVVRYCAGVTGHGGDHAGSDGTILPLEDHGEGDLASDIAAAAADSLPDHSHSHGGKCVTWHRDLGLFCWRPRGHDGLWHYDRVDGLAWRMDGSRLVTHTVPEAARP